MVLYHYTSFGFGHENIERQRLKVATLDSVNDPYEWVPRALDEKNRAFPAEWTRKWWCEQYKDKYGFLCFSKSISNPALWGYYGDKHKGIALGFEFDEEPLEMVYNDERVTISQDDLKAGQERMFQKYDLMIKRKATAWMHEEEYRLLVLLQGRVERIGDFWFAPFDSRLVLKEVVLGCKCTEQDGNKIRRSLDHIGLNHVLVLRSEMDDDYFLIKRGSPLVSSDGCAAK